MPETEILTRVVRYIIKHEWSGEVQRNKRVQDSPVTYVQSLTYAVLSDQSVGTISIERNLEC